jgi:hypothetical protein
MKYCLVLITPDDRSTHMCSSMESVSHLLIAARRTWNSSLQYRLYELTLLEQSL